MRRFVAVPAAVVLAAAAVLLLFQVEFFRQLDSIAYDFTMRCAGSVPPVSPTMIVAIDEESLRMASWPWSRDKLARLIERVAGGKPRVIAVDILLDDPTETDAILAKAVSEFNPIVLETRTDITDGRLIWRRPQPQFLQASVRLGHVHADPDFDGITRRVYSAVEAGGTVEPAFSVQTLHAAGVEIDRTFEEAVVGATIVRPQPINIRFVGDPGSFPQVSAWQVLEGRIPPQSFLDRVVLIGATAEAVGDQWRFTPFSGSGRRMSGVEIHANAIDTLYAGRWIQQTPGIIVFFGLIAALSLLTWWERRFEGVRFYAMALLMGPGVMGISWALMKYADTWFGFPPFLLAITLAVPGLGVRRLVLVNRDLDSKIEKLSNWGEPGQPREEWAPHEQIGRALPFGPKREAWLDTLKTFEEELADRRSRRKHLLSAAWRSSRWRLSAVDFFSEELVRFLSFNSAILNSMEDPSIVSDLRGRVVYQNKAASRLAHFTETPPFAPLYFSALLDGRDFAGTFADVFSQQKPVSMEFVQGCDGRQYHVTMSPIVRVGLVMTMHDTTAQYELNLAKNEMVSLVSHELRTPLTSIVGYSDMLLKYGLVEERGKQFLGAILDESHRLSSLIQSFLDIAYIESGRQKVTRTEFDLGPLFRDMLAAMQPVAAEKKIELCAPVDEVTRVRADRLLLYQALSNLVTNAVKYSPAGTTVRIAVSNGNEVIGFHVEDEGCGIPAEEKERVFEKFYRRANRETQEQTGFGLGLAFVKEVAVRHGGDVSVVSEVGKGSTFTLRIPV